MITPGYVATMAAYNAEMNRRIYAAAARLTDAARRTDQGAFWHSIHGTLNHLLWADRMWMARLAGWTKPDLPLKQSDALIADFAALREARAEADTGISAWASTVDTAWLAEEQSWLSGAAGREMRMPRWMIVAHVFNHQAHHRGQIHAMLTRHGDDPGVTDLILIPGLQS